MNSNRTVSVDVPGIRKFFQEVCKLLHLLHFQVLRRLNLSITLMAPIVPSGVS